LATAQTIEIADGATLSVNSGVLKADQIVSEGAGHVVINHRYDGMSQLQAEVVDANGDPANNTVVTRTLKGRQYYYLTRGIYEDNFAVKPDFINNYNYQTGKYLNSQPAFGADWTGSSVAFGTAGEHTMSEVGTIHSLTTHEYSLPQATGAAFTWHLIGNPYQIALQLPTTADVVDNGDTYSNGALTWSKKVNPGVYFRNYNSATGKYYTTSYNIASGVGVGSSPAKSVAEATSKVAPMQAFFVRSDDATTQVFSIDPTVNDVESGTVNLKASGLRSDVLRLTISSATGMTDETALVFAPQGSLTNTDLDAVKRAEQGANQIYVIKGSTRLAVPLLPEVPTMQMTTDAVQLGLTLSDKNEQGIITATNLDEFDSSTEVYLHDYEKGIVVNLREQNAYEFSASATTQNNRFAITLGTNNDSNLSTGLADATYQITISGAKREAIIRIQGNVDVTNSKVRITDMSGREVKQGVLTGNETHLSVDNQGIYIVEVINAIDHKIGKVRVE